MEEQKKVASFPAFDKSSKSANDEYSTTGDGHPDRETSTTGDGHPPRRGSTTGDGHPDRESSTTGDGHPPRKGNDNSLINKAMDAATGQDLNPNKK